MTYELVHDTSQEVVARVKALSSDIVSCDVSGNQFFV